MQHPDTPVVFPALAPTDMDHRAAQIAARSVICDIETEGAAVDLNGQRWYDTRPMTDPSQHCPEVLAMAGEAITYAIAAQLVGVHPGMPYLLRIINRA